MRFLIRLLVVSLSTIFIGCHEIPPSSKCNWQSYNLLPSTASSSLSSTTTKKFIKIVYEINPSPDIPSTNHLKTFLSVSKNHPSLHYHFRIPHREDKSESQGAKLRQICEEFCLNKPKETCIVDVERLQKHDEEDHIDYNFVVFLTSLSDLHLFHFQQPNPFESYSQHLSSSFPVVVSDGYVEQDSDYKLSVSLTDDSFPLLLSGELYHRLPRPDSIMKPTSLMELLSTNIPFYVINPLVGRINWLKYYQLCWKLDLKVDYCTSSRLIEPWTEDSKHLPFSLEIIPSNPILPQTSSSSSVEVREGKMGKLLIVFVYFETAGGKSNLLHFLQYGLSKDNQVKYIIVVNGKTTNQQFPEAPNLEILYRENKCFDIGTWGPIVAANKHNYRHFIILNSSVRGPFLSSSWVYSRNEQGEVINNWYDAYLSRLTEEVKLVGLAVNCPDGLGRKVPHLMSMVLAFDITAINVWTADSTTLRCAEEKQHSYAQESDLSYLILKAGYNIESMQRVYAGVDWRKWLQQEESSPSQWVPHHGGFNGCRDIYHDVFYRPGWYLNNSTPHPYEFVFIKTNRKIYGNDLNYLNTLLPSNLYNSPTLPKQFVKNATQVLLISHNFNFEGAPLWLYRVALILKDLNCQVLMISPAHGKLERLLHKASITTLVTEMPPYTQTLSTISRWADKLVSKLSTQNYFVPDIVMYNTILYARAVGVINTFLHSPVRSYWVIHEAEIHPRMSERNFYFCSIFPELCKSYDPWIAATNVIWVSDSTRQTVSQFDAGQFVTIHGFVDGCNYNESRIESMWEYARNRLSIAPTDIVISNSGTICNRKQQKWLLMYLRDYYDQVGENGSTVVKGLFIGAGYGTPYEQSFMQLIDEYNLQKYVILVNKTAQPLVYLASADIHTSVSTHEAFPLNTIEAMCLRIPLVATPAFGVREQITKPGQDGILLPSVNDYDAFRREVNRLVSSYQTRHSIGLQGRHTAESYFTESRARSQLQHILGLNTISSLNSSYPSEPRHQGDGKVGSLEKEKGEVPDVGKVCIVMRFYEEQLNNVMYNLEGTIDSIMNQEYDNWEILLVPTDKSNINKVFPILTQLSDPRIRILGNLEENYLSNEEVSYAALHRNVYRITDNAIAQCSPESKWLLVTNGDNFYHPKFLTHLDVDYDMIGFDFYSRWTNRVGYHWRYCDNIWENVNMNVSSTIASCMKNEFRVNKTDLGSVVFNLNRWRCEESKFSSFSFSSSGDQDGRLIQHLVQVASWKAKHIEQKEGLECLFDHNPNYHSCIKLGEKRDHGDKYYWDDTWAECIELDAKELDLYTVLKEKCVLKGKVQRVSNQ